MLINIKPNDRSIFTPGPGSFLSENLLMMDAYFGRGDELYDNIENIVLSKLQELSFKKNIVRMQGSATLALEISILNFVRGSVVIIDTGFYSDRLYDLTMRAKESSQYIDSISLVPIEKLFECVDKADWIIFCYVETSKGTKLEIEKLYSYASNIGARLLCDATASIGLEDLHELCDVAAFSSCKGLFGLTGAAFIAYNDLEQNRTSSFYLDIKTHKEKMVTGPYHTIASLYKVLERHESIKQSVIINKKEALDRFSSYITVKAENQPLLCTRVNTKLIKKNKKTLMYVPRSNVDGTIICHLGELHLGINANANILDDLEVL